MLAGCIDIHTHGYRDANSVTSTTPDELQLLEQSGPGYLSCGLHPWQLNHAAPTTGSDAAQPPFTLTTQLDAIARLAAEGRIVAIGECGLDRLKSPLPVEAQKKIFELHVDLAEQFDIPLVIHSVRSLSDIIAVRKRRKRVAWIVHGFTGNSSELAQCLRHEIRLSPGLALLIYMGVGDHPLHRLVRELPLESLYLESDGVDITIEAIYRLYASYSDYDCSSLIEAIQRNFKRDFGFPFMGHGADNDPAGGRKE